MQEKLEGILCEVQQLLPLLTACAASSDATSEAITELQERAKTLEGSSSFMSTQLMNIQDALVLMRDSSISAADVDNMLATLQSTMLELSNEERRTVQSVCTEVQVTLGEDMRAIMVSVVYLRSSVEDVAKHVTALQLEDS